MRNTQADSKPGVILDNVSYLYPRAAAPALKNITLEIQPGEFLGLIGPTGAGKTTLCLSLNGIVPQFYGGRFFGSITVNGLDTLNHPINALARQVGMVFEDPETQLTATSVENEIAFPLENLNVPRDEIRARIPQILAAVRLEGLEKKHPHELSGGQKQRLAIAAALALRPALLVLDEPTAQLDPVGAQEVFAVVRALNQQLGITVLLASHAAEELATYSDRVAVLAQGALLRVGPPAEIYSDVPFLYAHGLRPPQVAETFALLNNFRARAITAPVTLECGLTALAALGPYPAAPQAVRAMPQATPGRSAPPLIAARGLQHTYPGGIQALKEVSLEIHQGEYVLIAGQNGAGKSTLVKHFLKLLTPTAGAVLVGGMDTRQLTVSALARRIGYVAQNPDQQIFNATVWDEVTFALKNLGYSPAEVTARATESLTAMGLLAARDRHPLTLPRGDRARIISAAILAMRPECVIFDEPTTGQDYRGAKAILEVSRALHQQGQTVIVITHHLYLMAEYAERVIVLGQGALLLDAPIRRAFHETALLAATFLTPPQAVSLAQAIEPHSDLLTPAEVAARLAQRIAGE